MMVRWLAIALVIVAVGRAARAQPSPSPDVPQADGSDQADSTTDPTSPKANAAARYTAGQQKFDAGDFLGAASEFEAAYALDPDPVYLYNTAQAYRRGSACARAADYYRRFLAVVANPPNLDKVHHYLSELDACAKAEQVEEPTAPHEPAPVQPTIVAATPAPTAEGDRRIGIPLAVASAGVVALAAGGWLTHDVDTLEGYSQALCAQGMTCQWDASKQARADNLQSRGSRDSAISITAYAVGGAAIATAVLHYVFGAREPVAITPVASGAAITGSFTF